jgi:hypothetical protein
MTGKRATERPGPFAEDPSRAPPTKEQRNKDYATEKDVTGDAAKGSPGSPAGPHDKPHLTDSTKTPGAGTLPRSGTKDDAT